MMQLFHGDCLQILPQLEAGIADLVLADIPYGTTLAAWDSVLPLDEMWKHVWRTSKPKAALVFTATQPFTTTLIRSNIKQFKYCWVWEKSRPTGYLQAVYMPLKYHEDICVFVRKGIPTYNPQKTTGHVPTHSAIGSGKSPIFKARGMRNYKGGATDRYPKSVQKFKSERGLHSSQKPVALMEYLINTYTNEGETVLDFTMGSGTTGIACQNLNRNFIGIEQDDKHFATASDRIKKNEHRR